jgi:nitrilase
MNSSVCRAAAIQMVSGVEVEANLRAAGELIARAADGGAKLIALPEYFAIMGQRDRDKLAFREHDGSGPIQDFLAACAERHRVWLFACSVPLWAEHPDKLRNSLLVYDAQGRRVARYDKIHLFAFQRGDERYDEGRATEPGAAVVCADTPFGRAGLSICYDLRFPELYRAMGVVDFILVPSAFTATTGAAHWEVLLRARAIENLAYVIAPAQGGEHQNGRRTHGDSMIIDPWGVVLARQASGAGVVFADLDLGRVAAVRGDLPALGHRTL